MNRVQGGERLQALLSLHNLLLQASREPQNAADYRFHITIPTSCSSSTFRHSLPVANFDSSSGLLHPHKTASHRLKDFPRTLECYFCAGNLIEVQRARGNQLKVLIGGSRKDHKAVEWLGSSIASPNSENAREVQQVNIVACPH